MAKGTMKRRAFLAALGAGVVAVAAVGAGIAILLPPAPMVVYDPSSGIAMRFIQEFDISCDAWPNRLDVLYGHSAGPELACRVSG